MKEYTFDFLEAEITVIQEHADFSENELAYIDRMGE